MQLLACVVTYFGKFIINDIFIINNVYSYVLYFNNKHNKHFYILFSWPCLHQWLETRPTRQMCPVCKAAISKDKVIPLYGRGDTRHEDPR